MGRSKRRRAWSVLTLVGVMLVSMVMGGTSSSAVTAYSLAVHVTVQNMPAGVAVTDVSAHIVGPNGYNVDFFFNAAGSIYLASVPGAGVYEVTGVACATDPYDFTSWSGGQVTLSSSNPSQGIGVVVTWPAPATSTTAATTTTVAATTTTSPPTTAAPTTSVTVKKTVTTTGRALAAAMTEPTTTSTTTTVAPETGDAPTTALGVAGVSQSGSGDGGMSTPAIVAVVLGGTLLVGAAAGAGIVRMRRGRPGAR